MDDLEVYRARAFEARRFAAGSCGNDMRMWLEVADAWETLGRLVACERWFQAGTEADFARRVDGARRRAMAISGTALRQAA